MTTSQTATPRRALTAALVVALAVLPLLALSACAGGANGGKAKNPRITVFAAASLHEVFTDLATTFETETGVHVALSFAGSSDLVAQLDAGAPADVLITADERTMDMAKAADLIAGEPLLVASNHLVLVTPPDNPALVTGLNDSLTGANLVVCAPQVPCGAATERLAALLDVELAPVSQEQSVTSVLGILALLPPTRWLLRPLVLAFARRRSLMVATLVGQRGAAGPLDSGVGEYFRRQAAGSPGSVGHVVVDGEVVDVDERPGPHPSSPSREADEINPLRPGLPPRPGPSAPRK